MLDLKKLEKEFDDALAEETPESLQAWLFEERYSKLSNMDLWKFSPKVSYNFVNTNFIESFEFSNTLYKSSANRLYNNIQRQFASIEWIEQTLNFSRSYFISSEIVEESCVKVESDTNDYCLAA